MDVEADINLNKVMLVSLENQNLTFDNVVEQLIALKIISTDKYKVDLDWLNNETDKLTEQVIKNIKEVFKDLT